MVPGQLGQKVLETLISIRKLDMVVRTHHPSYAVNINRSIAVQA
jgi:hypothetical protein